MSSLFIDALVKVVKALSRKGVDVVLIGSTIVDVIGKVRFKEDDIDLFSLNISPLVEERVFRRIAEEEGWDFSYTDLGTPRYIVRIDERDIVVDIYENVSDFYIPLELLNSEVKEAKIKDVKIKHLTLEAYLLLKSRAGRDIDEEDLKAISDMIALKKLKISKEKIIRLLKTFPEEDVQTMRNRLKRVGIL